MHMLAHGAAMDCSAGLRDSLVVPLHKSQAVSYPSFVRSGHPCYISGVLFVAKIETERRR